LSNDFFSSPPYHLLEGGDDIAGAYLLGVAGKNLVVKVRLANLSLRYKPRIEKTVAAREGLISTSP